MARIPPVETDAATEPDVKAVLEGVESMGLEVFLNQFRTLAHHPPLAKAFHELLRAYYFESVVSKKYLEMSILLVSNLNRCNYCVVHHTPMGSASGLSAAQLDAIADGTWAEGGLFDEVERAVLTYTQQMNEEKGRVRGPAYEAVRRAFDDRQMVELTVRIAMCEFFNRFNEAFQIDIEPVAQALYAQAAK